MTKKEIKQKNFEVYNSKTKELIEKFNKLGPRKFDINNALNLHGENKKDLNILELGCFSGREYSYIRNFTKNYTGIDISLDAINYAKTQYNDGNFIVGDIEEYKFDEKFDIIFAFASLIHSDIETTTNIFQKFYKMLNNGGIVYVSMKLAEKYSEISKTDEFGTRVYYHYNTDEYKKLAGDDFEVIYEDKQNFNNQNWFSMAFRKSLKK